jgi:glycosyltransferase involved in cell wall biosynthesis
MKRLLFINYLIWKPDDPGFCNKYKHLSRYYSGSIFHLGTGAEVVAGNFRFYSLPWRTNIVCRQLAFFWFCLRNARQQKPFDVIICYDPLICGIAGLIVKLFTGAKLVIEVNGDHFWGISNHNRNIIQSIIGMLKMVCMRLSFLFSDAVKCINTSLAKIYSQKFDFSRRKISVAVFFDYTDTNAFIRSRDNCHGPILCVGHPYNIKGVDILIQAFNLIAQDYPDVSLKIIGHCDDRKPYIDLAEGNSRISFHKGMFYNEIVKEFNDCRFFVLPSRTESMGRVLIEAMASGKAVIASRVGGIPDVVEENKTGLLFESENYRELAEKMRQFLDNPDMMQRMGEAGHQRAKDHFSPERYLELYHEFLESLDGGALV